MDKDYKLFNCSQDHEHNYVVSLYIDTKGVRAWLKKECKPGGKIKNTTHKELYEMLKNAGYEKK